MVEQLQILQQHLDRNGQKLTRQRVEIVHAFLSAGEHVTAEELYHKLAADGQRVGLATVYRTLALLCEASLAVERHFGDGSVRYEPTYGRRRHDHMTCVRCQRIIEFESPALEQLRHEVLTQHGFLVHSHRLQLQGLCKECLEGAGWN